MRHLTVPDSDTIEAIGYEQTQSPSGALGALEVVFKATPNVVYRYEGVGPNTLATLVSAQSIGKLFHELFKKTKHPFTKSVRSPTLKK